MDRAILAPGDADDTFNDLMDVRVREVITRASRLLPAHISADLLRLVEPSALATMTGVFAAWAGSHFIGVGEIADVLLLVLGYAALGGVALRAASLLYDVARTLVNIRSTADYDLAAGYLAAAISLLGIQAVLTVLLRGRPKGTFRQPFRAMPSVKITSKYLLPRTGRLAHQPKLVFISDSRPGWGATNSWSGDIRIAKAGTHEERLLAIYHERVHSFFVPKVYLLRNLRCHLARSAYLRSYLLRYLEEALAESIARARVHGFSRANLIAGIQFPLKSRGYDITVAALTEEVRGTVYGPITVGGMVYNVVAGAVFGDE